MRILVLMFVSACTLSLGLASADPRAVYRWEDPSTGSIHYSTKPPTKDAKPANLPPIMRGESKIVKTKSVTCDQHGGVNCQAGSDGDGSAICSDGFKDVTTRFKFACSSPKLEITDISELSENGSFSVFLRNSKSVIAKKPAVKFKPDFGPEVSLTGPETVEAFGVAEFSFNATLNEGKGVKLELSKKPDAGQIVVGCQNCN